ncbi:MAG TPA: hypothetical protein VJ933_07900 [Phaeodactylibacter sp.]|nr:hypothetical protein [Phaeodactylibacter sp.]
MKTYLFLLFLWIGLSANAQDSLQADFPAKWVGVWTGELNIYSPQGLQQSVPMELHILPRDSFYTWTIVYGQQPRNYLLKPLQPKQGLYLIDEQNSIGMEATLINGKLYSRFEVMGNLLLSTVEQQADGRLRYEIISGSLEALSTSGGIQEEGEDMPEVKAYPVNVQQLAFLRKKE